MSSEPDFEVDGVVYNRASQSYRSAFWGPMFSIKEDDWCDEVSHFYASEKDIPSDYRRPLNEYWSRPYVSPADALIK